MKLKGSRSQNARLALLNEKITSDEFVSLPNNNFTPEYFQEILKDSNNDNQQQKLSCEQQQKNSP
jgi:hypothetical protein